MKNRENWSPSKFVPAKNGWKASRDSTQVAPQSRLAADIFAASYARSISQYATGDLLDHGCGQMPLFAMYRERVTTVTAIDWSHSPHRIDHADHFSDLNLQMPFQDESFDTVVSSDVVEHLWNPVAVFQDFARILRPDGCLILGTPFNYWMHEIPHDYFRWSPYAVRKLAQQEGFEPVEINFCGGHREVLIDTLLKSIRTPGRVSIVKTIDRLARWTGFVSANKHGSHENSLTLGTVSVLRRK